jgi:hypothetical protein
VVKELVDACPERPTSSSATDPLLAAAIRRRSETRSGARHRLCAEASAATLRLQCVAGVELENRVVLIDPQLDNVLVWR